MVVVSARRMLFSVLLKRSDEIPQNEYLCVDVLGGILHKNVKVSYQYCEYGDGGERT